jgi:hypothetical protein
MNAAEMAEAFPMLITDYIEDASTPKQVQPGPIHERQPSWSFTNGSVLTVGAVWRDSDQLRLTLGLAVDVPYSPEVSHVVNQMNNKEIVFGRMFLIGNDESGRGCILMQEIVSCAALSWEFPPSLQNLILVIGTLGGQASRLAPELRNQFGGRPFTEEDAFFLQVNG